MSYYSGNNKVTVYEAESVNDRVVIISVSVLHQESLHRRYFQVFIVWLISVLRFLNEKCVSTLKGGPALCCQPEGGRWWGTQSWYYFDPQRCTESLPNEWWLFNKLSTDSEESNNKRSILVKAKLLWVPEGASKDNSRDRSRVSGYYLEI